MTHGNILRTTIGAALLLAAAGADAATYHVTYSSLQSFGGPLPLSAASLVITTAAGINIFGGHDVTSVTGNVDGDAITGLIPLDGPAGSSHCSCFPEGYGAGNFNFSVSNTFYDLGPIIDHGGIGFESASTWYNMWIDSGSYWIGSLPAGTPEIVNGDYSAASFSMGTGSVPEPASWAMLIAGFGLAGGALRRQRSTTVADASA